MDHKICVRFAPSPTGSIHVGNARTAIFNWLLANKDEGKLVFRLEDTDVERSSEESIKSIKKDLEWLGVTWNDGPYLQSERLDIYKNYLEKLEKDGKVYKCFCTAEELETRREKAISEGKSAKYDGRCSKLTEKEIENFIKEGKKFSYRFKVEGEQLEVNDLVRGKIMFDLNQFGDFVVMRPNGYPVYNFSVVIDDALMGINHVIRGEDILPSTPKQILLYKAMGFDVPKFAHLSMINGPTGRPLHKRDGATSVSAFKEGGYLPEALFNFLSLLGWSPKDDSEILPKDEIISRFSLNDVSKSPAQFDYDKLKWMNGIYLREKTDQQLLEITTPFIKNSDIADKFFNLSKEKQLIVVSAVKTKLDLASEVVDKIKPFLIKNSDLSQEAQDIKNSEDYTAVINSIKNILDTFEEDDITVENHKKFIKKVQKDSKRKGKALYMSLRVALTGEIHGADLGYILAVLGKEGIKKILGE